MEKGLDRAKLKYLAIIAMVVDHTAWGFVDFMSPLGQAMHIFGRLTLPIMCFFIAEGYKHTSSLKKYISRMATFAIISIIPFYIFFHEEYGYRQNIIFDLLLALLALTINESKRIPKFGRIALVGLMYVISALIGGWVIMPIVYVFVFYYGKDFKTKAKWFTIYTVLMECVLFTLIILNQRYHFSQYDWTIEERIYLFFFILALIPLYFYNGKTGKEVTGRYFFYIFYPAHFLILAGIKYLVLDYDVHTLYIWAHVVAVMVAIGSCFYVCTIKHSKAQMATSLFMASSVMYVFSFLLEITVYDVGGVYTATKAEYFAECMVFITLTFAMQELTQSKVPAYIYAAEMVFSIFAMYCLFTYEKNGFFYSGISINDTAGSFPRMQVDSYGIVFYMFLAYATIVCIYCIQKGIMLARGGAVQRARLRNLIYAMVVMWMPYLVKASGLTRGYEVPAFGVALAAFFVGRAIGKYSFLDSVNVNYDNAINFGNEGIIVLNNKKKIMYHNEVVHEIFGDFEDYDDASMIKAIDEAFKSDEKRIQKNGHTYEVRIEPMLEKGEEMGKILWIIDQTEHYTYLDRIKKKATTDALTGINNRGQFENLVTAWLNEAKSGAFFMMDLDNFKSVNDGNGHQAGDDVLILLAEVLTDFQDDCHIIGRIGGDEFVLFVENVIDRDELAEMAQKIIDSFEKALSEKYPEIHTAVTIGIAILDQADGVNPEVPYSKLYQRADRALYSAKEAGKKTYRFYRKIN